MALSLTSKIEKLDFQFIRVKDTIDGIMNSESLKRITKMDMIYSDTTEQLIKLSVDCDVTKDFIPCLTNYYEYTIIKDDNVYLDDNDSGTKIVDKNIIDQLNYLTQLDNVGDYRIGELDSSFRTIKITPDLKSDYSSIFIHNGIVEVLMCYGLIYTFRLKTSNKWSLSIQGYDSYNALNHYYNECGIYFSQPYTSSFYDDTIYYVVGWSKEDVIKTRENINVSDENDYDNINISLTCNEPKKSHWWNKLFK